MNLKFIELFKSFFEKKSKGNTCKFVNNVLLKAWKTNIDIQFVLDSYACAMFIVSYIIKSQ